MHEDGGDSPERAIHILVSDALEALVPLIDQWAESAKSHRVGERLRSYAEGYDHGVDAMASEVKDQLVERIVRLRQ